MSFVIVLPADDSRPAELQEMGSERSAHEHIREMIGGLVEIVRARGLHHVAPELWPVMLVDDNGHAKGLVPWAQASDECSLEYLIGRRRGLPIRSDP